MTFSRQSTSEGFDIANTKDTLKCDLEDKIYEKVPVRYFAEHVWGLDSKKAQTILDSEIKLCHKHLNRYKQVLDNEGSFASELHQPFRKISRALLKDICNLFSIDHANLATYFWDKRHTEPFNLCEEVPEARPHNMIEVYIPVLEDGSPILDPDQPSGPPTLAPIPGWSEVRAIVEFKKMDGDRAAEESFTTDGSHDDDTDSLYSSETTQSSQSNPRPFDYHGSCESFSDAQLPLSPGETLKTGCKRSYGFNSCPRKRKRRRIEITEEELELSKYALQCFAPGNRHYVTGLVIDSFRVNLWYYDRTAAMRSTYFDFSTPVGTTYLGLVLFALSQGTMQQAGFDPHLHRLKAPAFGRLIHSSAVTPLEGPSVEMKDVCYIFPSSGSEEKRLFPMVNVIAAYEGITGRGTLVSVVKNGVVGDIPEDRVYILKQSWLHTDCVHEGDIITRLRLSLPDWHDHLPDPVFHAKITALDLGLPRLQIRDRLLRSGCTDKVLKLTDRDLVTNRYKHIWQAKDVAEFKRIFLDCLECHYHAYNTGRVLHRDISENNLMIYQPGETDKDQQQDAETSNIPQSSFPARGILNDFDMAAVLNPEGENDIIASYHYGTRAFLARDLLLRYLYKDPRGPAVIHFYRYDLESFFYILIWAATHYDLENGCRVAPATGKKSELEGRVDPDWSTAYQAKLCLFCSRFTSPLLVDVRKEWKGLWNDWVKPLCYMFSDAFYALDSAGRHDELDFDFATCGGKATFEKFMQTIGETPRGLHPVPDL